MIVDHKTTIDHRDYRLGYTASLIGVLVSVAFGLYGWFSTEAGQQVPTHFGIDGEPDAFGSRFEAFWVLPLVLLGVSVLLAVLPRIDPRRQGVITSIKAYNVVWAATVAFMAGISGFTTVAAVRGSGLALGGRPLMLGVGALFVVIGNFLPKTGPNWFFGIRTPWTLSDDQVWADTHRVGGILMMVGGAAIIIAALLAPLAWNIGVAVTVLAVIVLVAFVYSYLRYRSLHPA
ncbi:MAG: SdpI family protein [Acidimicrobiia bacterium]|nr:SdpI family protein [Acidimicrobiia bacterium]